MKKNYFYLLLIAFAASVVSCAEDPVENPDTTIGEPIELTINASTETVTRTSYTEQNDDYAFSWNYGDKLNIYSDSAWSEFTTYSNDNLSSASFTGSINSWSGTKDLPVISSSDQDILGSCSVESDNKLRCSYWSENNEYYLSAKATTEIKNMGLLVGVIEDATTTDIPSVALNQVMSFLQIEFTGDIPEGFYIQYISSMDDIPFVTDVEIDMETGEITESSVYSSALWLFSENITAENNVLTIALFPTQIDSSITLYCGSASGEFEYEFTAEECTGFFERNTVYSGSIDISEFDQYIGVNYCLSDINDSSFDKTQQFNEIYIDCESISELSTADFAGLRTLLANQNELVYVDLYNVASDIPAQALYNMDNIKELYIELGGLSTLKIGDEALSNCDNLEYVETYGYNSYKVEIGDSAFENCSSLEQFGYSDQFDNCTAIGDYAFSGCTNLCKYMDLHFDIATSIGESAFAGCSYINSAYFGTESEDFELTKLGANAFHSDMIIYLYDSNAKYLTGDKTIEVGGVTSTFGVIFLNGVEYVHSGGGSSGDPLSSASVINASKVTW